MIGSLIKTNTPGYARDTVSGALINTNDDHYLHILAERKRIREQEAMCSTMKELQHELTELKSLLIKAIGK